MHHLHLRSGRTLMPGVLGICVALAACRPAPTAPINSAETAPALVALAATVRPTTEPTAERTSAVVASPAVVDATVVADLAATAGPASRIPPPLAGERLAIATSEPPTPTLAPPPPMAATLPTDQPWFLVDDEYHQCGPKVYDSRLVAVDRAGRWTQLDRGITAVRARPDAPPLLATCAADGSAAIVDPLHWTSLRITLASGILIGPFVLSPDGKQAILQTICYQDTLCSPYQSPLLQIADLRTGAMRPFLEFPVPLPQPGGPYTDNVSFSLLGWGHKGLYYSTSRSKAGPTTLDVIDPADPQGSHREIARNSDYDLNIARDIVVTRYSSIYSDASLILSDLRQDTRVTIDRAGWFSTPMIAPDGTALVYVRMEHYPFENQPLGRVELVLYDIAQQTKRVLADRLDAPFELPTQEDRSGATFWSPDGQRIVVTTQSSDGEEASLLMRDGTLINKVPLPGGAVVGLTNDDQLVLEPNFQVLHWLPLRAGAAPYTSDVTPTNGLVGPVFLPPPDSSAAPPPTVRATPPPPATPTPLPSPPSTGTPVLAPITKLGNVPSDIQLFPDLPIYRHILYGVRGALYSQALRGGPAVYLGGDQAAWNSPLFITPDGNEVIEQMPDGIYRAPIAGGARVRLTPPQAKGDTATLAFAQVSSDGSHLIYTVTGPKPAAWKNQLRDDPWIVALYSVPVVGGTPVRLTSPPDSDSEIFGFMLTADSRRVIYSVDVPDPYFVLHPDMKIATRTVALYSVPIEGGTPVRLAESASADDPIAGRRVTDDGRYLLYQPRSTSALWSVAVAGGPPVRLDAPGGEPINSFWTSADNQSVFYETATAIYVVPIGGGNLVNLTSAVVTAQGIWGAQLTPDGQQVVFRTSNALYRVPVAGGPATRLSGLTSNEVTMWNGLSVAGGRAVYQDEDTIESVALTGGAPIRLTAPPARDTTLQMEQLSPDSRYVLYTIAGEVERTRAIYDVPIAGGPPVPLFIGRDDTTVFYTFSGGYAIGVAGLTLYAAPLAGRPAIQLSVATKVRDWPVISADGRQVVYMGSSAGQSSGGARVLYVATLPAGQP